MALSKNPNLSSKDKLLASADFQFFSVKEVAIILETSAKTIHEWIKDGKLPAFKVGHPTRLTRIRRQDLEVFIEQHIKGRKTVN